MTSSGFRVRVIGLVFVFKSASVVLKQVPTCIRKPKTNTFDKSIKFLHWLSLVFLDGFRSFQAVLGRFGSLLTLVSTHYKQIRIISLFRSNHQRYSAFNFIKKRLQLSRFPLTIAKSLRISFWRISKNVCLFFAK